MVCDPLACSDAWCTHLLLLPPLLRLLLLQPDPTLTLPLAFVSRRLPGAPAPAYLDGSLPGDFGFDPLGLGADPDRLAWYVEAELTHARWCMAAVTGITFAEATGIQENWAQVADYDIALPTLVAIQFPVMGFLELKRFQGWAETGSSGVISKFPFDPLGLDSEDMRWREVKNGRLAMLAMMGILVQTCVYGNGPVAQLQSHLDAPFSNTIASAWGN